MSILLWPNGAPLAKGNEPADCPSITTYLLKSNRPSSCIIVCPGGGYRHLSVHKEGEVIAKWLNEIGVSAVILHYRVDPYHHPCPLLDAQRAIRLLRNKAQELNIDPMKIGIMGFSAGGHLAAMVGTHYDTGMPDAADPVERESSKPDLMVLCYAVMLLSNVKYITSETPPTFLWMTAKDDKVPVKHNLRFASALSEHRVPNEMHIFESGRHGLALATNHPSVKNWTNLCKRWLKKQGFR